MAFGIDCSRLAIRTSFDSYAHRLLNVTNGNLSLLNQCKVEVCGALWGQGSGDISNVGVSTTSISRRCISWLIEHR